MTCSDFIIKYCEIYKLILKPIDDEDFGYTGPSLITFKLLIYLLRKYYGLSFRHIGRLLCRSHPDMIFHYNTVLEVDFYKVEAVKRWENVREIYEIQ